MQQVMNCHDIQELEIKIIMIIIILIITIAATKRKRLAICKFCDYPQEIVIALNDDKISQIQILSHQSKIASKIEIWVKTDLDNMYHDFSTFNSTN